MNNNHKSSTPTPAEIVHAALDKLNLDLDGHNHKPSSQTPAEIVHAALEQLNLNLDGDGLPTSEEFDVELLIPYMVDNDKAHVPEEREVAKGCRTGWKNNSKIYLVQLVVFFTVCVLGIFIGINIPEEVVCLDWHSFCHYLRVR